MSNANKSSETAAAVTPNDTAQVTLSHRALYVGTSGNLAVQMSDGGDVTFSNVPSGTILPIIVSLVKTTGTTASDILLLG